MDEPTRDRLYSLYASTHAGIATEAAATLTFLHDIEPALPSDRHSTIVDLGCGQGLLVRELLRHGFVNARGVDISVEQVQLAHDAGIDEVRLGDFSAVFDDEEIDVVIATDFFEHLGRTAVVAAFDMVFQKLRPRGRLVLRVPNAVSPFGGNYRHGDLTHETSFTPSSLRQVGRATGFADIEVRECRPRVHGARSAARAAAWAIVSGGLKLALAAETGVVRGNCVTQNVVAVLHKPALARP